MSDSESVRVWRKDYRPPAWWVDTVDLRFVIGEHTRVHSRLVLCRNPTAGGSEDLWLDGRQLTLESLAVDGEPVAPEAMELTPEGLWLRGVPDKFELTVVTEIDPDHNDSMEGLYRSGAMLCTQCEARGFSRITYFPDRPDVMARYTVRLEADRERYPVLLSNGNPGARGELDDGRHFAEWEDPFPKPCYLFAVVAGDLARVSDHHDTPSGRRVALDFYVDHGAEGQVGHAIESLKQAMRWDEQTYGLECDLDLYQVVAARDFNMGAMENKGLNLFNARFVLASEETATDADREQIRAVVAHEYFHNWTGNRVTCRDWFQLSLKEGLTVFREQQFCEAMGSPAVERIRQVRLMREAQFAEDEGPLSHAVRPESYQEINNFYTLTVYEKGAELIRMMQTLAGAEGFNRGVRRYLRDNDGRAAAIEDLVEAIEEEAGVDLSGVLAWYERAGTPRLRVRRVNGEHGLRLRFERADDAEVDDPRVMPVRIRALPTADGELPETQIVPVRGVAYRHDLDLPADAPVTVGLGFSAPVRLEQDLDPSQWAQALAREPDPVARWDAMRALLAGAYRETLAGSPGDWTGNWQQAMQSLVPLGDSDPALLAELLAVPDTRALSADDAQIDPLASDDARESLLGGMAQYLDGAIAEWIDAAGEGEDAEAVARRALAATACAILARATDPTREVRLRELAQAGQPMTLRMAALSALSRIGDEAFESAMAEFYALGERYPLVMDKWFGLRAAAVGVDVAGIQALLKHPAYEWRNPNRTRAVLGTFSRFNVQGFHAEGGAGYSLLAERIADIDRSNPQLAARLADAFSNWRRHAPAYAEPMHLSVQYLRERASSRDLKEVVERCLRA